VIAVLILVLLARQASAQSLIGLGRREASIDFGVAGDLATSTTGGVKDLTLDDRRTNERLGLRGDLYLVTPSLATLFYGTSLAFLQDRLTTSGQRLPAKARLLEYDVSANFLTTKKYGITLFANRAENVVSREFIGTTDTTAKNEGATLYLRSFILPGTVGYRRERFGESSRLSETLGNNKYDTSTLSYDGQGMFGSHEVSAHYGVGRLQDRVRTDFSYGSRSADFRDRYTSGGDVPDTFTSTLHYFARTGRLTFSSLFVDEDYRAVHNRSLSSGYSYTFSRFATDGLQPTTSHTAGVTVQHRLYQSLRTSGGLTGTLIGVPDGTSRQWGVRGETEYHKKLPHEAAILAGISGLYQISDNRLAGRLLAVFQEKHVARIGIPFRLDQPRPIAASILLTTDTGIPFQEGLDYTVRVGGEFAEIQILATGRIREGDNLLLQYRVEVDPSARFTTRALAARLEPDFGWVSPYYAYQQSIQHLIAGHAESPLEELRGRTIGVRVRWSRKRFSGTLLSEYHTQESRLIPYNASLFSQFVTCTPTQAVSLGITIDEAFYHYLRPQRETASGTGRFTVGWTPWSTFAVNGFVATRLWRDTVAADETYQDAGIRAQWLTPSFTFSSSLNSDVRRRNGSVARQARLALDVSRRF
jgi:hypothetical protein